MLFKKGEQPAQDGHALLQRTPDVERLLRQLGLAVLRAAAPTRQQPQTDADSSDWAQLQQQRRLQQAHAHLLKRLFAEQQLKVSGIINMATA